MNKKTLIVRPSKLVEISEKKLVTKKITITNKKATPIRDIEDCIKSAFFETFNDFTIAKTFREQDFRTSFCHHLRTIFKSEKINDTEILTDDVIKVDSKTTFKPDIYLRRVGKPTVVIELKNVNIINGKLIDYNANDGLKDIEKMKKYADYGFQKGYFIHLNKKNKEYSNRSAAWKDNFFNDFCFIVDDEILTITTYKAGKRETEEMGLAEAKKKNVLKKTVKVKVIPIVVDTSKDTKLISERISFLKLTLKRATELEKNRINKKILSLEKVLVVLNRKKD
jgi:hypothetical protein